MVDADWGRMFGALENEKRRRLLVALLEHNPQEETIADPEANHNTEMALEPQEMEMYHKHLPKLERAGYIDWDKNSQKIHKGPRFEEIRPLLELIENHKDELPDGWL